MDSITVIRKVLIKSIVTDELKKQLDQQLNQAITNTDQAVKVLEKERNSIVKGKKELSPVEQNALNNIEVELSKQHRQLADFNEKKKNYAQMKNGGEFVQGVVDSPCEMKIGDSFFERLSQAEIVLNDGEIVEINNI